MIIYTFWLYEYILLQRAMNVYSIEYEQFYINLVSHRVPRFYFEIKGSDTSCKFNEQIELKNINRKSKRKCFICIGMYIVHIFCW